MSTPLKNVAKLLPPRILSPASPKFLNLVNYQHEPKLENLKQERKGIIFPDTAVSPIKICVTRAPDELLPAIKGDVLINTPNKRKITKCGIEDEKNFTIMGKGSFGKVFKACYKGKPVAMKLVKSEIYHRERNALYLTHTNIVKTLEIIQRENGIFSLIITEYLPKCKNLQNVINNSENGIDYLKYAKDICKGLIYCHANDTLHLDIKPSNILLQEGICKLCDFGNSVHTSNINSFIHQGTIQYTAPEILLGKQPTEKCDVYSLGITLWQLKTRQVPYENYDNIECVIYKVVKCNVRPDLVEAIDNFSKLYQQCWDPIPNNRPRVSNILKLLSYC